MHILERILVSQKIEVYGVGVFSSVGGHPAHQPDRCDTAAGLVINNSESQHLSPLNSLGRLSHCRRCHPSSRQSRSRMLCRAKQPSDQFFNCPLRARTCLNDASLTTIRTE